MSLPLYSHTATVRPVVPVADLGTGEYTREAPGQAITVLGQRDYMTTEENVLVGLDSAVGGKFYCNVADAALVGQGDDLVIGSEVWRVLSPAKIYDHGLQTDHAVFDLRRLA